MTITNEESLTAITQAVRDVGWKVKSIEHLARGAEPRRGQTGRDAELPVINVELNQRGIVLGISFQGRLLLDYRPGGLTRMLGEQRQLTLLVTSRPANQRSMYCARTPGDTPGPLF